MAVDPIVRAACFGVISSRRRDVAAAGFGGRALLLPITGVHHETAAVCALDIPKPNVQMCVAHISTYHATNV